MDQVAGKYRGLALLFLVVGIFVLTFLLVKPFIPALLWATVLSVLMAPFYKKFRKKFSENVSAMMTTFLTLAFIGIPLMLVAIALYIQAASMLREVAKTNNEATGAYSIETISDEVDKLIKPISEKIGMGDYSFSVWVKDNKQMVSQSLRAPISQAAKSITFTVLTIVIAFLTMFFMLRDGHLLKKPVLELLPLPHERSLEIINRLAKTIRAVFSGVVLVAIIQGILAGSAYAIAGIPNALMWGAMTIVLCVIPLLGAPIIYIPLGLTLIMQGHYGAGIGLLVFCFGVVSQIDNLLRPWLIGAQTSLHPMSIFFSLLGGVILFGPIGVLAGPLILTLAFAMVEILREINESAEPSAETAVV